MGAEDLGVEVRKHHLCFGHDGLGLALNIAAKHLLGTIFIELRVILNALCEFVITSVGSIVDQHIKDESFLDGLFHAVKVERVEFPFQVFVAEALERFTLWRGCECEV